MGEPPCDVVQAEVALELLEGELALELPAHMRAYARAHADDRAPPAAPLVTRLASTVQAIRNAIVHEELADRALALMRLVAPIVIESDPVVVAVRREPPSWKDLPVLAAARNEVSRQRFGLPAIELFHRIHGCGPAVDAGDIGDGVAGWNERGPAEDRESILDAWRAVSARLDVTGAVRIDHSATARPRAFVVEVGREVVVVVPAVVDTPAKRFAVLHELGHAAGALARSSEGRAAGAQLPRSVDEGVASFVARLAEKPNVLPGRWASELAGAARAHRYRIAAALDRAERALPTVERVGEAPPWGVWHEPGAQAAYVAAEAVAERLQASLGPKPPRGQFAAALDRERDRVDRNVRL